MLLFSNIVHWALCTQESILPNLFLRKTKIFFCFLLLSLAILMYRQFFPMLQTLKLNNENLKNKEVKVWYDRLLKTTLHSLSKSAFKTPFALRSLQNNQLQHFFSWYIQMLYKYKQFWSFFLANTHTEILMHWIGDNLTNSNSSLENGVSATYFNCSEQIAASLKAPTCWQVHQKFVFVISKKIFLDR